MTPVNIPGIRTFVLGEEFDQQTILLRADAGWIDIGVDVPDATAGETMWLALDARQAIRLAAHLREIAFAIDPSLRVEGGS